MSSKDNHCVIHSLTEVSSMLSVVSVKFEPNHTALARLQLKNKCSVVSYCSVQERHRGETWIFLPTSLTLTGRLSLLIFYSNMIILKGTLSFHKFCHTLGGMSFFSSGVHYCCCSLSNYQCPDLTVYSPCDLCLQTTLSLSSFIVNVPLSTHSSHLHLQYFLNSTSNFVLWDRT